MDALFATDRNNTALLLQRLTLAVVMSAHGAQKVLGWFGGHGLHATIAGFTARGIPEDLAYLVVAGETLAMIGLAFGLFSRLCALGTTAIMLGAIVLVHARLGFFMDWGDTKGGEGFEYHLLALALSIPIMIWGGGRAALDTAIAERTREREVPAGWREADALR
jgi:putative oxidoreductase